MKKADVTGYVRYLGSIAGSFAVIALSFALILDASGDRSEARASSTPVAAQTPAAEPRPLPTLKPSDFDISRTVAVHVVAPTAAAPAALPEAPAKKSATVIADAVNLRRDASKSSARVSVVRSGTTVSVLETRRSWTRIATADGRTGWLASKFLDR